MSSITYRREIDGLRAIAIAAVVTYHAFGLPGGGFAGVDVFFVISGYLITALLYSEYREDGRISLSDFYARRARRLLPALFLVILTTVTASTMFLYTENERQEVVSSAIASLFFVANLFFQESTGDYFDLAADEMPLLHLWSLGVEEQFYLVWPLMLTVLLTFRSVIRQRILVLLAVASFLACELLIIVSPQVAFYQMPTRFWELAMGGLIALLTRRTLKNPATISLVGLLLIVAGIGFVPFHFPGAGALPATVGTALVLFTIHHTDDLGLAGRFLGSRPLVFLGLISYSLYLWHWPLLALDNATRIDERAWSDSMGLILAAVALAWLSYQYVETPVRRLKSIGNPASIGVAVSLSLTITVALVWFDPQRPFFYRMLMNNQTACHQMSGTAPRGLPPDSCNSIPGEPPDIVLWGDSHALAWKPIADRLAAERAVSAATYTFGSCPPARHFPAADSACAQFNERVIRKITRGDVKTVILSARLLPYFQQLPDVYLGSRVGVIGNTPENILQFESGMRAAIEAIAPHVEAILVMGPIPQLRAPGPRCLERQEDCAMTRAEFETYRQGPDRFLEQLADTYNVTIIEPGSAFCDARLCPPVLDGLPLYVDAHHVSPEAALWVYEGPLSDQLQTAP